MSSINRPDDGLPIDPDHVRASQVLKGRLRVLPCKAEVEARACLIEAGVVAVPAKSANAVLKSIDIKAWWPESIPETRLDHLRRLVKPHHLPPYIGKIYWETGVLTHPAENESFARTYDTSTPDDENFEEAGSKAIKPDDNLLYLLICPTTTHLELELQQKLRELKAAETDEGLPPVIRISVPRTPPLSNAQAEEWSRQYWPTVYKKHNPYGPQPSTLATAAAEIEHSIQIYIGLADEVSQISSAAGTGEKVGAVVVDRSQPDTPNIVAVAADARWQDADISGEREGNGNVMAHATMRAIGLIARKRREASRAQRDPNPSGRDSFMDRPVSDLEREIYARSSVPANGYLCLDLEFYTTHEPCVMCSMALVHSRVGRVIFRERMIRTGGLTAGDAGSEAGNVVCGDTQGGQAASQAGLGYGIFWRPSLNWKFLVWQWIEHGASSSTSNDGEWHA